MTFRSCVEVQKIRELKIEHKKLARCKKYLEIRNRQKNLPPIFMVVVCQTDNFPEKLLKSNFKDVSECFLPFFCVTEMYVNFELKQEN